MKRDGACKGEAVKLGNWQERNLPYTPGMRRTNVTLAACALLLGPVRVEAAPEVQK